MIHYPTWRSQNLRMLRAFSPTLHRYQSRKFSVRSDISFLEGVTLLYLGVLLLGDSPEAEELRSSPIQLAVLADFCWSSSNQLISGKCSFYLANPNPNFSYKIGIFAWQFACPVVSAYLYRNRKYRDLGYYMHLLSVFCILTARPPITWLVLDSTLQISLRQG